MSAVLLDVAVTVSDWPDSLVGKAAVMPVRLTEVGALSLHDALPILVLSVGASLTELTVMTKVRTTESTPPLAVVPLSRTVTVMVVVPNWSAAGAYDSEPALFGLV